MLTAKQQRAIEAMMTAPTIGEAAEAAGVHRNTLRKWLQDAQFCTALHTAGDERIAAISRRLATLGDAAVSTLASAMENADTWPARIRAADVTLARVLQLRELHELEARIAALEAAQNGKS